MTRSRDLILILDFGSQYTQLIARRIRELGIFSIVKPYDIGGMLMKPIFDQGKKDSLVNKGVNFLAKQNNKVPFLPKAGSDPKTDIGKRISDFTSKKLDKLLNRRNQNMGASDLKNTSSGMG